jgi:hypothetical protein
MLKKLWIIFFWLSVNLAALILIMDFLNQKSTVLATLGITGILILYSIDTLMYRKLIKK